MRDLRLAILRSVAIVCAVLLPVAVLIGCKPAAYTTVVGKVVYPEFDRAQDGDIAIGWTKVGGNPRITPSITLKEPGSFSFRVPRLPGEQGLEIDFLVTCRKSGVSSRTPDVLNKRLRIGDKGSVFTELYLKRPAATQRMEDYSGPTVRIAGKVLQESYTKGIVRIIANSGEMDIPVLDLDRPGDYSIAVPAGIGDVRIIAINIPEKHPEHGYFAASPGARFGECADNPIRVGSSDLNGVDIVIE